MPVVTVEVANRIPASDFAHVNVVKSGENSVGSAATARYGAV